MKPDSSYKDHYHIVMYLTIVLVFTILQSTVAKSQSKQCSTWMIRVNGSEECVCGEEVNHIVKCNNATEEVYVLDCYLITYDVESQKAILGSSIHGCGQYPGYENSRWDPLYRKVPSKIHEIDSIVCAPLNRTGRLCGACMANHSPLVYSYILDCVQCTPAENRRNWFIYISRAFIPLTCFYVFVVLFKFHAHFPSIHACILFCQLSSSPALIRAFYIEILGLKVPNVFKILNTFYGVWNLDFFRAIYPNLCLRITPVQALFLDYTIAFYPLLLILLTYKLASWYSSGNRIIQFLWSPFRWTLLYFRKTWDVRSSMINVFVTFYFLSYNKIIGITFDLLIYVHPFDSGGERVQRLLFYDASLKYFSPEHRIYGAIAVMIYFIFVFLPFLLILLYPLRLFQKCLNCCRLSHITLHSFVDSVTGYYEDGTVPGTRDCRCFAAVFLFLPNLLYISYAVTLNVYYYVVGGAVITILCLLFTLCQPYKEAYIQYRKVTTIVLVLMMFMHFMLLGANCAKLKMYQAYRITLYLVTFILVLPTLYLTILSIRWILRHNKCSVLYSKLQRMKTLTNASSLSESTTLITAFDSDARTQHLQNYQTINT